MLQNQSSAAVVVSKKKKGSWLWTLIHIPIWLSFLALGSAVLLRHVYQNTVVPIVDSYRKGPMENNFYNDFSDEFTYYNRHCDSRDLSTRNSNDLLVTSETSADQAGSIMLEHGAIALKNVLSEKVANDLRNYLAGKHEQKLHYNEVFWQEIGRLSLALGTHDDPSVAAALDEIGNNDDLKRALEGIVGEDPAIIEVSTLTSMHGSTFQELHTDSDWFGSSLLYGQSFLHSYSMFVALQNTTQVLGATTVCPGSHFCADEDIAAICHSHGTFSVSTSGYTGKEKGMMGQGDGFLFNQNIWHRGPGNRDPSGDDRIMLVMTFASRKRSEKDYRRQGLGTYYYMRWNMWGHTLSDLKHASRHLVQPWRSLRALGLLPSRGITWIHQFAQQLGASNDFYDDYVLEEFKETMLDKNEVPAWLRSDAESWERFIPETFDLIVKALVSVYVCVLVTGVIWVGLVGRSRARSFLVTSIVGHLIIAFLLAEVLVHVKNTDLGKSVTSGNVNLRPFTNEVANKIEAVSTLPERHDVLFSPRLEADFLESFTRFLDFHPGNKEWLKDIKVASTLPSDKRADAAEAIVERTLALKQDGNLPTRFLEQDMATGRWFVVSQEAAVEKTVGRLSNASKDATITTLNGPDAAEHWLTEWSKTGDLSIEENDIMEDRYQIGERVWAWEDDERNWFPGVVKGGVENEDGVYAVEISHVGLTKIHDDDLRPYHVWHTGDRVSVDYHGDGSEYFKGEITGVHPDGSHSILYDDEEFVERVKRETIERRA